MDANTSQALVVTVYSQPFLHLTRNKDILRNSQLQKFFSSSYFFFKANHEQALQDAAKKSNKQRSEIEQQIAEMKVAFYNPQKQTYFVVV